MQLYYLHIYHKEIKRTWDGVVLLFYPEYTMKQKEIFKIEIHPKNVCV